ncbi:MAG: WD40/YVTN/BNR-like repeat-containing protein [Acidimicrobiales bacterium]
MTILAGTSRGVFSIDGGESRSVVDERGVRVLVVVDGRCFAGTSAGLQVSDDGGETWRLVAMADREVWTVRAGGGVLYAGTAPAGLFRSDDRGDTWTEIESFAALPEAEVWCVPLDPPLPGRARAIVVDEADPDRVWVGVEVGGVARTTDGGATWKVELPYGNPDLHMMVADPGGDDVLFASTGYGRFDHIAEMVEGNAGVLRSDDGGDTWTYAWAGVTPRYSRPMCIDDRAPHALTVASAPTAFSNHGDEGGAQAMLFRSDDRGASWRSLCDEAHSPSAANFHGLTVDPERPGGVIVGTDTGEVWQVNGEGHWTQLGGGLPSVLSLLAF